jgi:hypothetical protein
MLLSIFSYALDGVRLPTAMMPRLMRENTMMKILIPSCSVQQQQKVVFVPNFWSLSHVDGL